MRKSHRHSHSRKKQDLSTLKSRLRGQSRKITGPRAAILEILRRHPHPLTNKEILSEMQKGGGQCDLATIYRSMHMLEKMGMVKRFDFGDGTARFELMGEN
ncbi:MAG TPA: transcriptional repressor, partial [Pseudomonadales bacterium]|nr:transcriptional repressor [Pseudomonadales bacterium]